MICVIMSTKPVTRTKVIAGGKAHCVPGCHGEGSAENAFYPPTSIYYEITFEKLK